MKVLKVVLFAIMMFSTLEGGIYLFVAFCSGDINWIPDSHWIGRVFYGIVAFFGVVVTIGTTYEYSQDNMHKNGE